jgi:hypothetical protein
VPIDPIGAQTLSMGLQQYCPGPQAVVPQLSPVDPPAADRPPIAVALPAAPPLPNCALVPPLLALDAALSSELQANKVVDTISNEDRHPSVVASSYSLEFDSFGLWRRSHG